jgi:rod shape-determining protein MreB
VGEATLDQIQEIGETVKKALEKTPPELAADVVEKGIVLTGGGALPKSFDKLLGKEQGFLVGLLRTPH